MWIRTDSDASRATSARLVHTVVAMLLGLAMSVRAASPSSVLMVAPRDVQLRGVGDFVRLLVYRSDPEVSARVDDVTDRAVFESLSPTVLDVDSSGRVVSVWNGDGIVRVHVDDQVDEVLFHVVDCGQSPVVDFGTEVQPLLASLGCSTGPCHGKQGGQNGFQLSLLGFDDTFDHAAITRHARGRRIFPSSPSESLLLRKATAVVPHGGGRRLESGDRAYNTLYRWIEQGAPPIGAHSAPLTSLTVEPSEMVLDAQSEHRTVVTATFADGARRDVTRLSAFQSNESVYATVDKLGVVRSGTLSGETAIMARFKGQIATCRILIPRAETVDASVYASLPRHNPIDDLVWKKLQTLNVRPSLPVDDAKFMRRVYVDLIGQLPTADGVLAFVKDDRQDKRNQLVDALLQHPGYADHWANKWVDLLRPNPYRVGIKAVLNYDHWIRRAFRENWSYDRFVRELITAEGSTWRNGAATFYRDRRSPDEIATMVSQLFLGVRLECAKCHHHPFEVWGQDDFYSFAAFFAQVGRKGTGLSPPISGGEEIVFTNDSGDVRHPLTAEVMKARFLGGTVIDETSSSSRRDQLVDWMTSSENPFFSRVIANRVWMELMGRGLVEPVDDLRATNPASNEPLLQALAKHLQDHDYDLKELIRLIATSYVYGLASTPNASNAGDHRNFSRHYRSRMNAEVLLDAIDRITESSSHFDAMPEGSRSNVIWTHRVPSLFLDTFGRPDANQDPPCERTTETAVVQTLHLMNSPQLHEKITGDGGLADRLAASGKNDDEVISTLYLSFYSRQPSEQERSAGTAWLQGQSGSRRAAIEDLLWALINSAEFVFQD